jgi:hypothetical protein
MKCLDINIFYNIFNNILNLPNTTERSPSTSIYSTISLTSGGTRLCPGWEIARADILNHMKRQRLDRLDVICINAVPLVTSFPSDEVPNCRHVDPIHVPAYRTHYRQCKILGVKRATVVCKDVIFCRLQKQELEWGI